MKPRDSEARDQTVQAVQAALVKPVQAPAQRTAGHIAGQGIQAALFGQRGQALRVGNQQRRHGHLQHRAKRTAGWGRGGRQGVERYGGMHLLHCCSWLAGVKIVALSLPQCKSAGNSHHSFC